jgi:putative copper resistance protein D
VAGAALIVMAASVAAWSLAYPHNSLTATLVRAVAACAAVTTLGLAAVPILDVDRYRGELIGRATALLASAGAVWLLAVAIMTVALALAAALAVTG